MTTFWNKYDYYHHFANEYTETQESYNLPQVSQVLSGQVSLCIHFHLTPEAKYLITIIYRFLTKAK